MSTTSGAGRQTRAAHNTDDPVDLAYSRLSADTLALPVRGQWLVEPTFRPSPAERTFGTPFLIVHVERQGCAYFSADDLTAARSELLVGRSVAECQSLTRHAQVATVDAVYRENASGYSGPQAACLDGSVTAKAEERAAIVAREAHLRVRPGSDLRAALVGYSGEIALQLERLGFTVTSYDLDPEICDSDRTATTRPVARGEDFYANSALDAVVATGMTLVTETFPRIVAHCRAVEAPLIMYCQSGANLGPLMIECGASSVIAEHIPFYNFEGLSRLSTYRD
jgi:hypothetical protein